MSARSFTRAATSARCPMVMSVCLLRFLEMRRDSLRLTMEGRGLAPVADHDVQAESICCELVPSIGELLEDARDCGAVVAVVEELVHPRGVCFPGDPVHRRLPTEPRQRPGGIRPRVWLVGTSVAVGQRAIQKVRVEGQSSVVPVFADGALGGKAAVQPPGPKIRSGQTEVSEPCPGRGGTAGAARAVRG